MHGIRIAVVKPLRGMSMLRRATDPGCAGATLGFGMQPLRGRRFDHSTSSSTFVVRHSISRTSPAPNRCSPFPVLRFGYGSFSATRLFWLRLRRLTFAPARTLFSSRRQSLRALPCSCVRSQRRVRSTAGDDHTKRQTPPQHRTSIHSEPPFSLRGIYAEGVQFQAPGRAAQPGGRCQRHARACATPSGYTCGMVTPPQGALARPWDLECNRFAVGDSSRWAIRTVGCVPDQSHTYRSSIGTPYL
jgi:hypothetical protein